MQCVCMLIQIISLAPQCASHGCERCSWLMYDNTVGPLYKGHCWDPAGCPVYREVSLIQSEICTQVYVDGTAGSVLIREVSLIQGVLY